MHGTGRAVRIIFIAYTYDYDVSAIVCMVVQTKADSLRSYRYMWIWQGNLNFTFAKLLSGKLKYSVCSVSFQSYDIKNIARTNVKAKSQRLLSL